MRGWKTAGRPDAREMQSLLQDIAARMDRQPAPAVEAAGRKDDEAHAIEPLLAEIGAKLDAIGAPTLIGRPSKRSPTMSCGG